MSEVNENTTINHNNDYSNANFNEILTLVVNVSEVN